MSTTALHDPKRPESTTGARSFVPIARPFSDQSASADFSTGPSESDEQKRKQPLIQRHSAGAAAPAAAPPSVHRTVESPGRPLDGGTRDFMESRFGHDFSQVRVHTDSRAADSARAVNADAYAVGNHIAFASGKYQPNTHSGRQLLAHELAHTVQQSSLQRSTAGGGTLEGSSEYRRLEGEAESAAQRVGSGAKVGSLSRAAAPVLSRQPAKPTPPTTAPAAVTITTEVTKLGVLTHTVEPIGPVPKPSPGSAKVRKFKVDPFYLPGSKGEGADKRYTDYIAANQLRSVVGFNATGQPRTELWQSRDRTEVLGESWLQQVGWPVDEKDTRWQAVTGQSFPFPKVGSKGEPAQIDHIIELQLGGTNNPSNLRPLDADPNGESGRLIWEEVSKLAKGVKDEPTFAVGADDEIELSFAALKPIGEVWSADYSKPPMNALKAHAKAMVGRADPKDDGTTKYIRLAAGANIDDFAVPADWGGTKRVADLNAFPFNKAPSQIISSLKLNGVNYVNANGITVDAELDMRNRTRIPLDAKAVAGGQKIKLTGAKKAKDEPYALTLPKAVPGLKFDYPYLSPVEITSISLNQTGDMDWKGTLTPSVKLIGPLGLEFTQGELKVVKGIDKETLKKTKVLGFAVTDADLKLTLAPTFDIEANLKFAMGSGTPPIVAGEISLKKDDLGVVGTGTINVNLPKIQSASSTITYKGGGGRDDWTVKLHIKSDDIKLGAGYSITGELDAIVEKGELKFAGQLTATLPGNNSATLGLRRSQKGDWQLYGKGTFKVPKINQIEANATYDLGTEILVVSVATKTGFKIPVVDLTGNLDNLTLVIDKNGHIVVTGKGSLDFERGKAKGHATVELLPGGFFKGEGEVSYKLREDLTVKGGVVFDETAKPKLRVNGELKLEKLKLFDGVKNDKQLLKLSATIPVPGLSAGTSGVVITVGGGLTLGYAFGPGVIAPIIFKAGFNPLEDTPDLSLEVDGTLSIPASAYVTASAFAEAGLQVDALIAKGGIAAGLELTGKIALQGEIFANMKASYKEKKLAASIVAGLRADLILGLALTAYVRAYAESIIGLGANERWDWVLKQASFPTGLKFELSAPFGYDSDTGIKLPSLEEVKFEKPDIDAKALIQNVWGKSSGERTKA